MEPGRVTNESLGSTNYWHVRWTKVFVIKPLFGCSASTAVEARIAEMKTPRRVWWAERNMESGLLLLEPALPCLMSTRAHTRIRRNHRGREEFKLQTIFCL